MAFGALPVYALGEDWITWLQELGRAVPLLSVEVSVPAVLPSLALGLCAIWLHAMLCARYGPGPSTALLAGSATWLIIAVAHSSLFLAGLTPVVPTLIALGVYLPVLLISTVAGSRLYQEGEGAVEPAKATATPSVTPEQVSAEPKKPSVAAPVEEPVPARTAAPEETESTAKKVPPVETIPAETEPSPAEELPVETVPPDSERSIDPRREALEASIMVMDLTGETAVLEVLKTFQEQMTPLTITEHLKAVGWDFEGVKPQVAVDEDLKNLVGQGDVEESGGQYTLSGQPAQEPPAPETPPAEEPVAAEEPVPSESVPPAKTMPPTTAISPPETMPPVAAASSEETTPADITSPPAAPPPAAPETTNLPVEETQEIDVPQEQLPVEEPPPEEEMPVEEPPPAEEPPSVEQERQELEASVAVLELNDEMAVLEVMKAFTDPLTPGAIAEHLTAVNWNFEGVHPRVAVNKALKDLAREGQVNESSGKYQVVEQPPEAPPVEEPPAPPEPPPVEAPPPAEEPPSVDQGRQELEASVAVLKLNDEMAVLEVMKTFTDPLTPGAIAEHLTAVNWNFEGVHPRVAVNKALKDLAGEGQVNESSGKYQVVEQPPEAPPVEEPPAPPEPPPVEAPPPAEAEASIKQGRQELEASIAVMELNDEVAVLEVMKTFQEPLAPDTIGQHLAAVNWNFEDQDPQEAINQALQELLAKGKVTESDGKYGIAAPPPETGAATDVPAPDESARAEEPPAPKEPPPVEVPPPVEKIPAEIPTPAQPQDSSLDPGRQELQDSLAVLEANDELAVLEVLKTFTDPLTPGAIAGHLTAVNWNFEGVHPRVAVNKALKDLIREGKISESGGQYQIVEQPPEAPIEEPVAEAPPPADLEASIKQGREELEASIAIMELNDEVAVMEVLKTFKEPLSPDTIGQHLAAVNWDFEDRDPQEAINESLQKLLESGKIKETSGDYELSS